MAATGKKRPAKLASKKKGNANTRACPTCEKDMIVVKIIRQSGPSGMFWRCDTGHELPTH